MAPSVAGKPKKMLTKSIVWLWMIDLDEKTYILHVLIITY